MRCTARRRSTRIFASSARERLVEQQDLGTVRERAGECDALLLAAGQLSRHAQAQAGQVHELEQLLAAPAALVLAEPTDLEGEFDVLGDGHVAEQGVVLKDDAHTALLRRKRGDVTAMEDHAAVIARREPRDHPEDRALAAAARPQEDEQLPIADLERDLIDDRVAVDPLGDLVEDDRHAALAYGRRGDIPVPEPGHSAFSLRASNATPSAPSRSG